MKLFSAGGIINDSHRLPDLQDPSSTTGRFWEASFKEMAAENEDWSDMEPAMGVLEDGEMLETAAA